MGVMEFIGCTLVAFGPPLAIFLIVIVRDPLRIILFVLGAFFWLMSLLMSSLWWYAVVPLRKHLEFAMFFSVVFQEIFRFLFFLLLKKAEKGLEKVSANGMQISGVHSLKHAKHTVALVCGLGFGVMSGLFALVNVLADSVGAGTIGFPARVASNPLLNVTLEDVGHGDQFFFLVSSFSTSAFVLLNVVWTVVFWTGCRQKQVEAYWWFNAVGVLLSHFAVSGLSLLNEQNLSFVSIPFTYAVLWAMCLWAFSCAGGSGATLRLFISRQTPQSDSSQTPQRLQEQSPPGFLVTT